MVKYLFFFQELQYRAKNIKQTSYKKKIIVKLNTINIKDIFNSYGSKNAF